MEDAIFTRVSIREFTNEAVSDEQVERLMEAAMAAPSAGNQQPWEFVLTRDPQVKEALAACSPYAHPAGKCDLVIVPCVSGGEKRFEGCVPLDMSACAENILLEAQSLGLGAVWLGIYPEQDRIDAVTEVIGGEEGCIPFALIAVGHPKEMLEPRSAKRLDMSRVRWV